MELLTISLFTICVVICVYFKISIVIALAIGYIFFTLYGVRKGIELNIILENSFEAVKSVSNILKVFLLIGILTAVWRSSGTIAGIVTIAAKFITPNLFLVLTFILNAILSILMGTAFGTSATMGIICISIARTIGINEVYTAGAILSGIYVGDRCSPMSSGALLIAIITKTDIFENLKLMFKTSLVPIFIASIIYYLMGIGMEGSRQIFDVTNIYIDNFNLNIIVILPAVLIVVMSLFKIDVKKIMMASIILSILISVFIQNVGVYELIIFVINGFKSQDANLNAVLAGGGIRSMTNASLIIIISCSYAGIFTTTNMLENLKRKVYGMSKLVIPFGAVTMVAITTAMISCNQSLCSILTNQLTEEIMDDQDRALAIENTSVVITALVPWNIAAAIPLSNMEVGPEAIMFAFYMFIIVGYNFMVNLKINRKSLGHSF
ncbi:Na+/H+ antiporter NhaC family protein [Peptoniphilus asaccharolyticus]